MSEIELHRSDPGEFTKAVLEGIQVPVTLLVNPGRDAIGFPQEGVYYNWKIRAEYSSDEHMECSPAEAVMFLNTNPDSAVRGIMISNLTEDAQEVLDIRIEYIDPKLQRQRTYRITQIPGGIPIFGVPGSQLQAPEFPPEIDALHKNLWEGAWVSDSMAALIEATVVR